MAFGINARDAASLPTNFSYDSGLTSFAGSIEHTGTVLFNNDTVVVGDFTIAYDVSRVGGARSGFFVESTTGISAILFDIAVTSVTADNSLIIGADLLVSDEFGGFLFDNGFASSNLAGADVGDALVEGLSVPTPGAAAVLGLGGLLCARRRRSWERCFSTLICISRDPAASPQPMPRGLFHARPATLPGEADREGTTDRR